MRGSEQITPTVRELRMDCGECGARMVGQLSLVRTVRESDCANAEVRLPFSNPALSRDHRHRPANDDAPIPANDDGPDIPAAAIGAALTPG